MRQPIPSTGQRFGHMRRASALATLALGLLLAGGAPVLAQINPFGKEGGNLTKEDWTELNAAKAKALADPAAVGTHESWTNAKSGHSGTIDITKEYMRNGLPCRTVNYAFKLKASDSTAKTFVMNECKAPDGSWKFV